jgi:hypothetical protein
MSFAATVNVGFGALMGTRILDELSAEELIIPGAPLRSRRTKRNETPYAVFLRACFNRSKSHD